VAAIGTGLRTFGVVENYTREYLALASRHLVVLYAAQLCAYPEPSFIISNCVCRGAAGAFAQLAIEAHHSEGRSFVLYLRKGRAVGVPAWKLIRYFVTERTIQALWQHWVRVVRKLSSQFQPRF
jgi:hypothetical protein